MNFFELSKKLENDRIKHVFEDGEFCFFFIYEKILYAAEEESRLVFAHMKDHECEEAEGANFIAINLLNFIKTGNKEESMRLFNFKAAQKIEIISDKKAIKMLGDEK